MKRISDDFSPSVPHSVPQSQRRTAWAVWRGWADSSLPALLLAVTALFVGACQSYEGASSSLDLAVSRAAAGSPVILREGDAINVVFAAAPEYNSTQKIRTDGKISLAFLGETTASGKTLPQLQQEISDLYKPQLQNPTVMVTLVTSSDAVILSGELNSPGRRVFDKPTTLLEAILDAGGFSEFANESKVRVIRVVGDVYQTEVVDMKDAVRGRPVKVVYVKGGDIIHVPE
jgi:protein involved in polysaccharide export with SLBB domain